MKSANLFSGIANVLRVDTVLFVAAAIGVVIIHRETKFRRVP